MPANFDRGILTASTWHNLNEIGELRDAAHMITEGERTGAWPTEIHSLVPTVQLGDAVVKGEGFQAIVAAYAQHEPRMLGVNGARYNATTPEAWRDLIKAATAAGAKPTGAFSLRDGRSVLATFEVAESSGIKTQLVLADSFDGASKLVAGFTSIRVVCCNTLAAAMRQDGKKWAQLRHTSSLAEKTKRLEEGIVSAIEGGSKVIDAFNEASRIVLTQDAARAAFDALFPEAPEEASASAKTRAKKLRQEAHIAATLPINRVGSTPGNLGTLWNAATYLVDRRADGSMRETRGGRDNMIDSMLFGSRAKRLEEIQTFVEVMMADGSVRAMTVPEATESGVEKQQIGSSILQSMLDDLN